MIASKYQVSLKGLQKKLEQSNQALDHALVKLGLQKPKPSIFEPVLPQFLQEFILNLNCGATLESALSEIIRVHATEPEYYELYQLYGLHQDALKALNAFARKVEDPSLWRLTQLANQKHLTGSQTTVQSLEFLLRELWQKRHSAAKAKSEQVTVILTFILMLSLFSVIIVIVTPITLMLNF